MQLQLWGVIGTWVASAGTVAAVIASLWFSLHQNAIKLKVYAGHRIRVTPGENDTYNYCCISVVNVGLRPATISNISWHVRRFRTRRQMIQMFGFSEGAQIPTALVEGEEAMFMLPFHYKNDEDDWIASTPKQLVGDGSPRILRSLKVGVHTSIGKSFYVKAEKGLIEQLEQSYGSCS